MKLARIARTGIVAALLLAAACRDGVGVTPLDGGRDLQQPLPMCASAPNCLGCCTAHFESGALDYDVHLMSCACTPSSCMGACAATVCGTSIGIDKRCRDCLDGTLADGGVCLTAASDCLVSAGPCAAFADCVAGCPH